MGNLAGMNLALSRLNKPSTDVYVETIDGLKTITFLVEYYNRCQKEKQNEENKKQEIAKRLEKISTIVKGDQSPKKTNRSSHSASSVKH